jgi:ATP-dependent protease ClpP protease subunit
MYDILLHGEINHDLYSRFSEELKNLEEEFFSVDDAEITIELCSDGGDATVALAFFDRIKSSHLNINVHASGLVASAAVLILAAGATRSMGDAAWVMVHEEQIEDANGSVSELEKETRRLRRMETQWCRLMASTTTLSFEGWTELHKSETWLDKPRCKEIGLING